MQGRRIKYTYAVDVFSFGIMLSELASWTVCYSAGIPDRAGADSDSSASGSVALSCQ